MSKTPHDYYARKPGDHHDHHDHSHAHDHDHDHESEEAGGEPHTHGVADLAAKRVANEEEKRARLAAGELGLDMYKMREKLAEMGLKYL